MKQRIRIATSVAVSLMLLLAIVGGAEAYFVETTSLPAPQITVVSGNPGYTSQLLAIQNLPGVTSMADGMLVPSGYADGSKQFEGMGLKLSSLGLGAVKLCFASSGGSEGWAGKVGLWDGKKWQLLATTISAAGENPYSWACATAYADGTYAFIKWIDDPSKITAVNKPDCGYAIARAIAGQGPDATLVDGYWVGSVWRFTIFGDEDFEGKSVTVTVLSSSPDPDSFTLSFPLSGTLTFDGIAGYYFTPDPSIIESRYDSDSVTAIFHLDFGSCVQDVSWSSGPIDR